MEKLKENPLQPDLNKVILAVNELIEKENARIERAAKMREGRKKK